MTPFSEKQMQVLCWWGEKSPHRNKLAVICDGAVRSGKTTCMGISFFLWAMARFQNTSFAVCGKTIRSVRRNVVAELIPKLKSMGFSMRVRQAENEIILSYQGRENRFYLFGGRDESSPSLSEDVRKRYRTMFSGAFYSRFIEGKWTAATGLIYPFALDLLCEVPKADFERYAVSIDYGTVNPTSMGLWGLLCGVWYRADEYYFDARLENTRRTDEEHFKGFLELIRGRTPDVIVCDPSAASFITLLQSRGFAVTAAKNDVLNGIRMTATALRTGQIKVTKGCVDAAREFSLYRWADDGARDVPVKENDHAMDDIRYFVSTVLGAGESFACAVQRETGKGVSIWDF